MLFLWQWAITLASDTQQGAEDARREGGGGRGRSAACSTCERTRTGSAVCASSCRGRGKRGRTSCGSPSSRTTSGPSATTAAAQEGGIRGIHRVEVVVVVGVAEAMRRVMRTWRVVAAAAV